MANKRKEDKVVGAAAGGAIGGLIGAFGGPVGALVGGGIRAWLGHAFEKWLDSNR
ncbi:MAG: hypothetical protein WAL35_08850 [Acidimicrobiales bacterium]